MDNQKKFLIELADLMDKYEQEIYVRMVWRDKDGCVVGSQMVPSWISGDMVKDLKINIEASDLTSDKTQRLPTVGLPKMKIVDDMPRFGRFIMVYELAENSMGIFANTYQWIDGVLHVLTESGWEETENSDYRDGYYLFKYIVKD